MSVVSSQKIRSSPSAKATAVTPRAEVVSRGSQPGPAEHRSTASAGAQFATAS
ncbi:hypothetical protein [Kineosporia succinea]